MSEVNISIIIPARNEEDNLGNCLDSVINQGIENFEIIVVDDQSTDKTPEIIQSYLKKYCFIKLIRIDQKPEDWVGKNYALYCGFSESRGQLLLFIDSDVVLLENCLKKSLKLFYDKNLDIMSYAALQECKNFSEYLVQPIVFHFLNLIYNLHNINQGKSSNVACNGIFILINKIFYEKIGTHAKVKNEILEDVMLAKEAKNADGKLNFIFAPDLIKVRMYKSFEEIWQGWSKNFYQLLDGKLTKLLSIIIVLFMLFYLPIILLLIHYPYKIIILSWLLVGLFYFCYSYYKMGYKFWWGLASPFGGIILIAIMINSFINYKIKKTVKWKNREYKVNYHT